MNPTEHQIQQLIMNYLTAKGWYVQRMNSGAIRVEKHLIRMASVGTPDIMAFRPCPDVETTNPDLIFIEVKRPGKEATFNQIQAMKLLTEHGAECLVAHSLEEVQEWLE